MNKKYEEWRDGLPDLKWLDDVLPDTEQWKAFNKSLSTTLASFKNSIQLGEIPRFKKNVKKNSKINIADPRIKQAGENKMSELRDWFDTRLENAIEAAIEEQEKKNGFETTERTYQVLFKLTKCFTDKFKNEPKFPIMCVVNVWFYRFYFKFNLSNNFFLSLFRFY